MDLSYLTGEEKIILHIFGSVEKDGKDWKRKAGNRYLLVPVKQIKQPRRKK